MLRRLSDYDDYLCLKPPLLLWIGVLYLSRAISLPLLIGVSRMAGMKADMATAFQGAISASTLIPSMIALPVLYALLRRSPSGSAVVRWIWARGRLFIGLAAGLDFSLSLVSLWSAPPEQGELTLLAALFDLYFLLYVLVARRVRDAFADFPARLDPPGSVSK